MPVLRPCRQLLAFAAVLLLASSCGPSKPEAPSSPQPGSVQQTGVPASGTATPAQETAAEVNATCRDEQAIRNSERNRDACFHLQPGITTTKVVKVAKHHGPAKHAKAGKTAASSSGKKGQKTAAKKSAAAATKVVQTTGCCQPQSLIYARCRTGISTCRLGDTSPVQWFACARKNNGTSALPVAGSVMVLDVNAGRGMPTGHPAYVEEVKKNSDGTWNLRISHTNYDRKCHLDQDATVLFDPKRMTACFVTGPWGSWAKNLKTLGFIIL